MIISLERIQNIIKDAHSMDDSRWSSKKHAIDLYEQTDNIRTCDSAFPIMWHRAVTNHFNGLQNIGNWCWGYGENVHGLPLPCCERSLVILEILLKTETPLIFNGSYITEE